MKVAFVSLGSTDRSRTGVYKSGLQLAGMANDIVADVNLERPRVEAIRRHADRLREADVVVVGTGSQLAVPLVRYVTRSPVLLDAGWPLRDGAWSRRNWGLLGANAVKILAVDAVAATLSDAILVESHSQREFMSRHFPGTSRKLRVLPTGLNEKAFGMPRERGPSQQQDPLRVLWRGAYNPEAGLEVLWDAAPLLQSHPIKFTVICGNLPEKMARAVPPTVTLKVDRVPAGELGNAFNSHDLMLGQLSSHPRLDRTIPHKAYEAAYFGLPYISAYGRGIGEFLDNSSGVRWFKGGSATSLVEALGAVCESREELLMRSKAIRDRYYQFADQRMLARRFANLLLDVVRGRGVEFSA